MAQYDRLSAYDVDITALANVTLRDIKFSQGYAYVLTSTHIYRHPLTSGAGAGTAQNIAISSGVGDSKRLAIDDTHLYVGYDKTANNVTTNTLEKRSLNALSTVIWSKALSITKTGTWTGLTPASNTIYGMATTAGANFVVVHYLQQDSTFAAYNSSFSKSDGTHVSTVPRRRIRGRLLDLRGSDIYDNILYVPWYVDATNRGLAFMAFNDTSGMASTTWSVASKAIYNDVASTTRGFGVYKGVAWYGRASNRRVELTAYQLSTSTPSTPFVNPPSPPTPGVKTAAITYKTKSITGARYKNKTLTGIRYKDLSVVFS